ncbi:MAG: hypothetical protein JWL61_5476 [Gemmatimonadetes bacterium]|nr:hypothetical protein [Gemmatimonadota bacterium]
MACYYCQQEWIANSDNGACAECVLAVCAAPPSRKDKKFHASRCGCGCRKLVCIYDLSDHARNQHSSAPSDCFSDAAVQASSTVLSTAIAELTEGRSSLQLSAEAVTAFNHMLNFVSPGHSEIGRALGDLRKMDEQRDVFEVLDDLRRPSYNFAPEFFLGGAIDKMIALAGHTAVRAWHHAGAPDREGIAEWLPPPVVRVLSASRWRDDAAHFSDGFLDAFTVSARAHPSAERALYYSTPRMSASEIADWFLEVPAYA